MEIAVIGAGFAGLSAAKVLTDFGHRVTVLESAPDVGGVWSATRRYPGLETQNNRDSYCLPDLPMPRSYPEWPRGEQVQRYLAEYAARFELTAHLRLSTTVTAAEPTEDGWRLTARKDDGIEDQLHCEQLVVANGIFSYPFVPEYPGAAEHRDAGGRLLHTSQFSELEDAAGRHVVIVGYGKSACDLAVPLSEVAASTTVVARQLIWKMPKRPGGLNMKYLLMTRMGEGLFRYIEPRGFERFLHGPGKPLRDGLLAALQALVTRQLQLKRLGLVPDGPFEDIARSTVSLATEGFYERVGRGAIRVERDREIVGLSALDGRPSAALSDGRTLSADLVVCGTGWRQEVPFFSEELQRRLTDERGNFELYRQIHPLEVPRLFFCGYNSSFFSPLSAEIAALWIAAFLAGDIALPEPERRRAHVQERLRWMEQRTRGHHSRGTNVIPFSMHNVDEMLSDIGLNVSALTRLRQWLAPIDPTAYSRVAEALLARHGRPAASRERDAVPASG